MASTANLNPGWKLHTPTDPSVPPFSVFAKPLVKSEQDDRDYRIIQLSNGLKATIVTDSKADKAAASLDVAVGHLYDPSDYPGLAHFCEHLLFMGTELYPKENEYSEYLAKHNGSSNAYTSTTNTNYYFSVGTPSLQEALSRFAAFFHCPLFAPSCTSRELNAVNSEHKKNHQSDLWRIFQLNKHLTKPGHPWSKFGSGNRDSLTRAARDLKAQGKLDTTPVKSPNGSLAPSLDSSRIASPTPSVSSASSDNQEDGGAVGRETRRRLLEWWTKEYCASRMHLCVIGKESLDELSEMVSRLFSPILNRGQDPVPMIQDHPFGPQQQGTLIAVQTIMDFHALELSFPLEWQPPMWRYKPGSFVSHLLGHEGPGSLYSYLKNKGWATGLSTGPQSLARAFSMFKVTVYLTESGFAQYRDVVATVFKYIAMIKASTLDSYHQSESTSLSHIRFRFAEKRSPDSYATWLAEHSIWPVPEEYLISAPQLSLDWPKDDPAPSRKVREYIDSFNLDKGRVVLMAKKEELEKVLGKDVKWDTEPWYGTDYNAQRFDEEFIAKTLSSNDIPELFLPKPNEFIPTNLDVAKKDVSQPEKRPHLIRETSKSILWHKKDDQFWTPKAYVMIDLRSPFTNTSPQAAVSSRLFADLVNDTLSEYSYDADLAGLSYQLSPTTTGLYIAVNGYNDKMSVLVKHILEKLKGLVVLPDRLAVMKQQAKKDWENFALSQSYQLSDYFTRYIMTEQMWTQEEKLAVLDGITVDMVQSHIKQFLSQVHMRLLVVGNVYKDEAIRIAEMTEEEVGMPQLPLRDFNEHGMILPPGSNVAYSASIQNPNQANSGLTYYVRFGSTTDERLRVISSLLVQILSEPAFNVLRTQEQLGYIVFCSSWVLPGRTEKGMRIVIQSERKPGYLEGRVDAFLVGMKSLIEEMEPSVFEEQKNGLKRKWTEVDKNLGDEVGRYMSMISDMQYDFYRNDNDAKLLGDISKEDVLGLFMSHVHPSSKTRAKLSVHMISQKTPPAGISWDAALAFEGKVREANIPDVDASAWVQALSLSPDDKSAVIPLQSYGKHWVELLATKPGGKDLLQILPTLMKEYPSEEVDDSKPLDGVTYISDAKDYKKALQVTPDLPPFVQWGDLPVSRF